MREFIRGLIISAVLLAATLISLKHYLAPPEADVKNETAKIANRDTVLNLISILNKDEVLRKPSFNNIDLSSSDIIKVIFDNLATNDYQLKLVPKQKIACYIDNMEFVSDGDCTIRVVSNDTLDRYQNKLFNLSNQLEYKDFEYKGEICQNNGYNYYCLVKDYENNISNYSYVKDSYLQNGKLYVEEYYLAVNETDYIDCLKYYGRAYCENHLEKPYLSDEKIIKYGVLYRHVYGITKDGNYYLEKSYILDV